MIEDMPVINLTKKIARHFAASYDPHLEPLFWMITAIQYNANYSGS